MQRAVRAVLATALVVTALAATSGAVADAPPGTIRFTGRNLLFTGDGVFHRWSIRAATIDEAAPERSRVEIEIDVASLDTDNAERDGHLRGADFFDVARYPTASVVLENFRMVDPDQLSADVSLALHGTTRRFPMRFTIEDRAARRIAGRVVLKRTDFSIGAPPSRWNPLSIDDDVEVRVEAIVPRETEPSGAQP